MRRGRSKKGGKHSHQVASQKHTAMMRQIKGMSANKYRTRGVQ